MPIDIQTVCGNKGMSVGFGFTADQGNNVNQIIYKNRTSFTTTFIDFHKFSGLHGFEIFKHKGTVIDPKNITRTHGCDFHIRLVLKIP